MPEGIQKLFQPFLSLPPAKRWLIGGVVALSVVAFATLIMVANKTEFRPLFSNLNSEDAGEISKRLKEQKIPFRIESDGKAILVPADKVYELRLSLAADGVPQGGGVGFEIFDRKNFGMTEFVQKLNYQRALQGELARTIAQLGGVEQARVHLALPEKSLFKEEEKPATASVVLKMKSNRSLRDNEVQGIIHLVASAVEGMDPEQVSILDNKGKMLSKGGSTDATSRMTSTMMETQRSYEKSLEERLQSLLDKAVGSGKSVARVTATFDFKQVEKYEEKYDPETSAVRSEQRSEEKAAATATASGVPGVQSNLGRTGQPGAGTAGGGSRSDETLNYEVSRMTARTVEPVGTLSKVSVAILVDGKYAAAASTAAKPAYTPRSPDELQKIEALVKSAVGYNGDRGDQITVVNIPFQETGEELADPGTDLLNSPLLLALLKNGLIGAGFLLLILFVLRPLLRTLRSEREVIPDTFVMEESEQDKLGAAQRAQLSMQAVNQMELLELVKKEPYQTAQILQNWLKQKD